MSEYSDALQDVIGELRKKNAQLTNRLAQAESFYVGDDGECRWYIEKSWWDIEEWFIVLRHPIEGTVEAFLLLIGDAPEKLDEDNMEPGCGFPSVDMAFMAFDAWWNSHQKTEEGS